MDAKDLMIGDIVSVTPSSMLIRIAAIHRKKVAYHACNNSFSWVRVGLLQPIPLTPEILENNGFRKESYIEVVGGLDTYYLGEEIGSFRIHRLQKGYYQFGLAKINFVHQLQHALRLCGVRKEIEL